MLFVDTSMCSFVLIITLSGFSSNLSQLEYPHPEEVDVRVYTTEGILLASTPFTFYDISRHNSDMMLQILSQQLQSYFPGGTANAGGVSVSHFPSLTIILSSFSIGCY